MSAGLHACPGKAADLPEPARSYSVQTAPIAPESCRPISAGSSASPISARPWISWRPFFQPPALNERERLGLIKAFEYCFELGWNTLRDLLLAEGNAGLIGSRDTLRLAFRVSLIRDGESWLAMVQDRNLTSYTYNRATAVQVSEQVGARYLPCFRELRLVLNERVQATARKERDG